MAHTLRKRIRMHLRGYLRPVLGASAVLLISPWLCAGTQAQCPTTCGDVNQDGTLSLSDVVDLRSYLYATHVIPDLACAEVDDHELVTFRDFALLWWHFSPLAWPPLTCPNLNPSIIPLSSPDFTISHTEVVPSGISSLTIEIVLNCLDSVAGVCLPLTIRVNGEVPTIGAVSVPSPLFSDTWAVNTPGAPPASVVLHSVGLAPAGSHVIGNIEISLPATGCDRPICIEYPSMPPEQNGQLVTRLMILRRPTMEAVTPDMDACALQSPGDVDNDGVVTAQDFTELTDLLCGSNNLPLPGPLSNADFNGDCQVNQSDVGALNAYLATGFPIPVACTCPCPRVGVCGDINADCVINSADIIALVNYVFKGGAAPCFGPWVAKFTPGGGVTSASVIALVNFVFKSGAQPNCP